MFRLRVMFIRYAIKSQPVEIMHLISVVVIRATVSNSPAALAGIGPYMVADISLRRAWNTNAPSTRPVVIRRPDGELAHNSPSILKKFQNDLTSWDQFYLSFRFTARTRSILSSVLIIGGSCDENLTFPSWFLFGAATAAYQVEGGWNESDKGESIWDRLMHTRPDVVVDGSNGDVACDTYHLWQRDIEMAQELGLDLYRFSISWPRILPSGFPNHISEDGKNYYNNLIDGLLEKGIQPLVTMYHWDLPQYLQDLGGWANPLISTWFADYARVLYTLYADRVKYWLTLNEPMVICDGGYGEMAAPYLDDTKIGQYLCNKHVLMAHAEAYRIYDEEFRHLYHGMLSLSMIFFWLEPETPADAEATNLTLQLWEGRYAHAIYSKSGGWPPELENLMAENSKKEGYPRPRLPPFTPDEIEFVKGTYDFYALNHYTTRLVRKVDPGKAGAWPYYGSEEIGVSMVNHPDWATAVADWFAIYPEGLGKQLHWIKDTYGVNDILITENGLPTLSPDLYDLQRLDFIRNNLEQVYYAINDGIHVMGYTVWSIMDNFEWTTGYISKYGLYAVDFSSINRTRTPRESARFFASVTRTRSVLRHNHELNYEEE